MAENYRLRIASGMTTAENGEFSIDTTNIKIKNGSTTQTPTGLMIYQLAEPIKTPLTKEQIASLKSLQSYECATNVFADSMATLEVEYFKNTENGKAAGTLKSSEINKTYFNGTADKAIKDGDGNVITDTYAEKDVYGYTHISMGRDRREPVGAYSVAIGTGTIASEDYSCAIGNITKATGMFSNATGKKTKADGLCSHAEGENTTALSRASHAEGYSTNVMPTTITVTTDNQTIINSWNSKKFSIAKGKYSHSEGVDCLALGDYSHAEGNKTIASGESSHAEGNQTQASGSCSHAAGYNSYATGDYSYANGFSVSATGEFSYALGTSIEALDNQFAFGHYNDTNIATANSQYGTSTGTAFVIGNGEDVANTSNAFRVTGQGATYAKSAYNSTGADYAEFSEWADGNPNNEDRRGYFVTFDETKTNMIRKANAGDYVLGIVSGNPCIIGNSDEAWLGRYVFDEFGNYVYEEKEIDVEQIDPATGEVTTTKETITTYKLNPDYDPDKKYIHRKDRPEWDAVGWIGVLAVRDDGTCKAGSYCKVADGGIATAAERGSDTYRVLERVTDNIIKVAMK